MRMVLEAAHPRACGAGGEFDETPLAVKARGRTTPCAAFVRHGRHGRVWQQRSSGGQSQEWGCRGSYKVNTCNHSFANDTNKVC